MRVNSVPVMVGLLVGLVQSRAVAQTLLSPPSVVFAQPLLSDHNVSFSEETLTGNVAHSTGSSIKGGAIAGTIVGVVFGTIFVIANDESTGTKIGYGLAIVAVGAGAGALLGLLLSGAD